MEQFNLLKKRLSVIPRSGKRVKFHLHLDFDETGAFLQTVDLTKTECVVDPTQVSGRMRDLLRAMAVIRERQGFQVDWQGVGNRVYVHEHDYLLELARQTESLRLTDDTLIQFADRNQEQDQDGYLELAYSATSTTVPSNADTLKWCLCFHNGKTRVESIDFRLLSERYLLFKDTIYEIEAVGENFAALPLFDTTISSSDLRNYLALVCSSFTGVRLRYQDFGIRTGQPVASQPAIIFENVDAYEGLRLSVTSLVENYNPDFFSTYEISKVADINDMEKNIVVREVTDSDTSVASKEIRRLLLKHKKKLAESDKRDFYIEDQVFIIEKDLASRFLYKELAGLLERYILLGTEKLSSYNIKAASQPELSLRLNHGIDFLEGEGTLTVENDEFNLVELLKKYRKKGFVTLSDGTNVILEKKYVDRLQRIFDRKGNRLRLSFFDLPLVEELIESKLESSTLPQSRQIFLGFNTLESTRPRIPKINGTLRDYQKYGYKWLRYLHKHSLGGCLADDMGLGKTIQAIALLAAVTNEKSKPSLIVMPKTLLFNWAREIATFYPALSVYTWYGAKRDISSARSCQVILTTYGMVRNNIETFQQQSFFYVILDESQHIKNIHSQISRAIMLLDAKHRLALSGTPIENNLGELYSLFRFLNPAMFRSEEDFSRRYGRPIQHENDESAIHELKKKVYPFILRRLKRDVLTDLPDKVEQMLYVEMTSEQQKLYEERRVFYQTAIRDQISVQGIGKSQFFILQALSELRQIASCPESRSDGTIISPKRELLTGYIQDAVAGGHKVIVFANFLSGIEATCSDLKDAAIPHLSMTGATRNRRELVDRFQNDDQVRVFVMTLKTGGVGLNLTAADTIFIYDPWWNLAAENQAVDRSHRIGQDRTVFCYKLICRGTIEEKMVELQEKKRELLDAVITSDSSAVKSLTADDVDFMLG